MSACRSRGTRCARSSRSSVVRRRLGPEVDRLAPGGRGGRDPGPGRRLKMLIAGPAMQASSPPLASLHFMRCLGRLSVTLDGWRNLCLERSAVGSRRRMQRSSTGSSPRPQSRSRRALQGRLKRRRGAPQGAAVRRQGRGRLRARQRPGPGAALEGLATPARLARSRQVVGRRPVRDDVRRRGSRSRSDSISGGCFRGRSWLGCLGSRGQLRQPGGLPQLTPSLRAAARRAPETRVASPVRGCRDGPSNVRIEARGGRGPSVTSVELPLMHAARRDLRAAGPRS